jgi:PAS domain S-box-containing protein
VGAIAFSTYYEYRARRSDYLSLLERQATLFINAISSSTQNALSTAETIENEFSSQILSSLKIIEKIDQRMELSESQFEELLQISNLEVLYVYDSEGNLTFFTAKDTSSLNPIPSYIIQSKLRNAFSDTILAIYDYENPESDRLIAFVNRRKGGLFAATIGQKQIQSLRSALGIGYFLKRFQSEENIEYILIQNSQTIVAGSFEGFSISPFSKDPQLKKVLDENKTNYRILDYNGQLIFETISPFYMDDTSFGVLRLGLSMEELESLIEDTQKGLYLFFAVLIVFGLVFANFLINYRHRKLLRRDLERLQDYTNTILDNLSNGVISIDKNGIIQSINKQALKLLEMDSASVMYNYFAVLPLTFQDCIANCLSLDKATQSIKEKVAISKNGHKKFLALTANLLKRGNEDKTCILVVSDITDQLQLEEQIRRNQRLTATRNLAFSVAHEVKNPLNSLKLLIDLIQKKYKPSEDVDTYSHYLSTIYDEINRIRDIIEQYLRYSRPPSLTLTLVNFPELIDEVSTLFAPQLRERNIVFRKDLQPHQPIKGDRNQLKQVFINLIKNAQEAIEHSGEISITGKVFNSYYEIRVKDDGKGVPEKDLDSIFDLHFTTKPNGNGVGLTVVLQIIMAHNAKINVESEEGHGTTFVLQFTLENSK